MNRTPRRTKAAQDVGREFPFAPASDSREPVRASQAVSQVLFELDPSGELLDAAQQHALELGQTALSHEAVVAELGNPDDIGDINGMPYVR